MTYLKCIEMFFYFEKECFFLEVYKNTIIFFTKTFYLLTSL